MDFFRRHLNVSVLVAALLAQVLLLAFQVKKSTDKGSTTLLRNWSVSAITPVEKLLVYAQHGAGNTWHGYFYLRGVRRENEDLKQQLEQMRLEQIRLREDANQARRIQALLAFKEQYISKTVAAQVIGTGGTEQSRILYIDRGTEEGLRPDMAVITPQGIVGKVLHVFSGASQVLMINDQSSGVGVILTKSRLQGIISGTVSGELNLKYIMADEHVDAGDEVVTAGGDRIFPKGMLVGKVASVSPGKDVYLNIKVTPAAYLSRVEEVLVITEVIQKAPDTKDLGPIRASDILAERLPSVPQKAPDNAGPASQAGQTSTTNKPSSNGAAKPTTTTASPSESKPATQPTMKPAANGTVSNSATVKPATPAAGNSRPAGSTASTQSRTAQKPKSPGSENTSATTPVQDR